jgi:hypothetical protein
MTLVSTFGPGNPGIMATLRVVAYDRLILVVGEDAQEDPSYHRIFHLESFSREPVTCVQVDPFDFRECFSTMNGLIASHNEPPDKVVVSIAGGTKLLSCAALLAAFQNGVEVYHVEDELTKLPVILGVTVRDRFSENEIEVVREVRNGETLGDLLKRLSDRGYDEASLRRCLWRLQEAGFLRLDLQGGKIVVRCPRENRLLREVLLA